MTFKETIANDVEQVFFEDKVRDEFTSRHTVDGVEMTVIIDDNEQIEREKRGPDMRQNERIFAKRILFYVSSRTYGKGLPSIGRAMLFDGRPYVVTDAIDEAGVYSISLEAVRN